jgi:hypothetical protein
MRGAVGLCEMMRAVDSDLGSQMVSAECRAPTPRVTV